MKILSVIDSLDVVVVIELFAVRRLLGNGNSYFEILVGDSSLTQHC